MIHVIVARQAGADGAAQHRALEALAVLLQALGLAAPAADLVGHGGGHVGQHGAVFGEKGTGVALQGQADGLFASGFILVVVLAGHALAGGCAHGLGREALAVPARNTNTNNNNNNNNNNILAKWGGQLHVQHR
jgi:hypothetical protein